MKKTVIVGLAILAVSTSAAFAKHHRAMKPKAAAAAPMAGPMMGPSTADNMKMYKKNMHDSGMKPPKKM